MKFCLKIGILTCMFLLNGLVGAQPYRMGVSVDMANFLLNAYSLRGEYGFKQNVAFRSSVNIRKQQNQGLNNFLLGEYRHYSNQAVGLSAGLSFADHYAGFYPYFAVDAQGVFYDDTFMDSHRNLQRKKGVTGGAAVSLGTNFPVWKRISIDVSVKLGYTIPVNDDRTDYFYPGLGYSLSSVSDAFTSKSVTFLPSFCVKYNFVRVKKYILPEKLEPKLEPEIDDLEAQNR